MRAVVVLAVSWVVLAVPRPAQCCSCPGDEMLLPQNGGVNLPTNTAVWLSPAPQENVLLTETGSGATQVLNCERVGSAALCRAAGPLAPRTSFRVEPTGTVFATGDDADDTAPNAPSDSARQYASSAGGGDSASCQSEEPSGSVFITLRSTEPIVVLDVGDATEAETPLGAVTAIKAVRPGDQDTGVVIGSGVCFFNRETRPEDRFPLRAGAFDLAGNFSGWVRLEDAHIPDAAGPGCACSGSTSAEVTWWVVAAMVMMRRRARTGRGWGVPALVPPKRWARGTGAQAACAGHDGEGSDGP